MYMDNTPLLLEAVVHRKSHTQGVLIAPTTYASFN